MAIINIKESVEFSKNPTIIYPKDHELENTILKIKKFYNLLHEIELKENQARIKNEKDRASK